MEVQMRLQPRDPDSFDNIESKQKVTNDTSVNSIVEVSDSDDEEIVERSQNTHMEFEVNKSMNGNEYRENQSNYIDDAGNGVEEQIKEECNIGLKQEKNVKEVEMRTFNSNETPKVGHVKPISKSLSKMKSKSNGTKWYACDHCEYGSNFRANLVNHVRIHTGEKPFQCKECSQRFKIQQHLKRHLRRIHNIDERPFECEECLQRFARKHNLEIHMQNIHSRRVISTSEFNRNRFHNLFIQSEDIVLNSNLK